MPPGDSTSPPMTSNRPYILRALYDWIVDNGMTPHVLVDVAADGLVVPPGYVDSGKIVFNISPAAVKALEISNEAVRFDARFNGRPHSVFVPIPGILAIYAKENGKGMIFPVDANKEEGPDEPRPGARPSLKVVK